MAVQTAVAQEKLNRHVMAVPQSASGSNFLVSWRMLDTDDDYTTFDVLRNGEVVVRKVMRLSCTYDHRLLDGSAVAKFQMDLRDLLQSPLNILL